MLRRWLDLVFRMPSLKNLLPTITPFYIHIDTVRRLSVKIRLSRTHGRTLLNLILPFVNHRLHIWAWSLFSFYIWYRILSWTRCQFIRWWPRRLCSHNRPQESSPPQASWVAYITRWWWEPTLRIWASMARLWCSDSSSNGRPMQMMWTSGRCRREPTEWSLIPVWRDRTGGCTVRLGGASVYGRLTKSGVIRIFWHGWILEGYLIPTIK